MSAHSTSIDPEDASATEAGTISSIYSFLALTMRYPDPAFFDQQFLDTLESLLASLDEQTALAELQEWRARTADPLDDLRTEYTRLFITAPPRKLIPPYASVYLDGDGTLCGKTTERTRDFYRERGYDLADNTTEPADHISFELDFLAALAGEARFDDEELFLRTLFRPWFERFQEKSIQEARHPFYKTSIQLIDFFTKEEQ
jgi:TorA maturation chaperone TorD